MSDKRIRKQVYELTAGDLDRYPVWEFALDEEEEEGQDEATIRPYELRSSLDPSDGMFIVRARLTLADGTRMLGYLTPPVQGDATLGTLQPAIVTTDAQVSFWYGMCEPKSTEIAENYSRLGKSSADQVFPLRFESDVDLISGVISGEVPGFMVLHDLESGSTRVVR
ncbi:MAG: hypothetical protein WA117_12580 [Verrucomicrobiia bacterium]